MEKGFKMSLPQLKQISKVWPKVKEMISVPHTEQQYDNMVGLLDSLIDEIGENQNHPLTSYMETLGTLIEAYEVQNIPVAEQDNVSILKLPNTELSFSK